MTKPCRYPRTRVPLHSRGNRRGATKRPGDKHKRLFIFFSTGGTTVTGTTSAAVIPVAVFRFCFDLQLWTGFCRAVAGRQRV